MSRSSERKVAHAFVATLLVALLTGALIPSADAQDKRSPLPPILTYKSQCENIAMNAGWGQIGLPTFGSGEQRLQSYAVDAWNKRRLFVTNGTEVYRSMNGGCTWTNVYTLPSQPTPNNDYSALDTRIEHVVIPEGTTSDKIVYFVLDQYRAPQGVTRGLRTRVFRSENNGGRWIPADGEPPETLPPHGGPEQLVPSPSYPKVLYLLMETPDVQYMASSSDGGESWEATGPVCVAPALPQGVDTPVQKVEKLPSPGCIDPDEKTANAPEPSDTAGIAIDPFQPNDLWYYGPRGLERSLNSGKSPKKIEAVKEPIAEVDVYRTPGIGSRIIAAATNSPHLYVSQDSGATWEVEDAPGLVRSIAKGRVADEYAAATDSGVYVSNYGAVTEVGPVDGRTITNLQSALELGGKQGWCVFGSSGSAIDVGCVYRPPDPPPRCRRPGELALPGTFTCLDINRGDLKRTKAARFDPEDHVVKLERGESTTVPYTLDMFKSPTPLDVYFLIDISGSMQNTIDGVAHGMQQIINELTASKINTHFGVGVYRAYDHPPAYRQVLDIAPPGDELERALENLIANSGGDETQLAALYQSATGEGQDATLPVTQAHIEPNQEANFRPEALNVIIHATDEEFSTLPPHPSFDEVITALNGESIEQVGLAIQEPGAGGSADDPDYLQTTPRGGLLRVAEGTKTYAVAPVDCNGDGEPEIQADQPLVCNINPDRAYRSALMAGAIVELLNSVEDIGDLTINVDAPPGVVPNIDTKLFANVDFKHPPLLEFDVMFTCPLNTDQKQFRVDFDAIGRTFLLAETTATVRCVEPKEKPDPPPKPDRIQADPDLPPAFFPFPAFFPPVVRPPDVSPNPGPNTQTQAQSQSQAQAQSAMAKQKQEQAQLALAYSKGLKEELAAERAGESLNMSKYRSTSSRRQEDLPPGVILMMSASALSLAFGLAAQKHRIRTQPARRNRRRPR